MYFKWLLCALTTLCSTYGFVAKGLVGMVLKSAYKALAKVKIQMCCISLSTTHQFSLRRTILSELACIINYKNLMAVFIVLMVDLNDGE